MVIVVHEKLVRVEDGHPTARRSELDQRVVQYHFLHTVEDTDRGVAAVRNMPQASPILHRNQPAGCVALHDCGKSAQQTEYWLLAAILKPV